MDRSKIALIIPAFNEEATIRNVVKSVVAFGRPIVVDDGSTDNTSKLAGLEGATVISHLKNLGYEAALNSGFEKAIKLGVEYVITLDADGQHNSQEIPVFISLLESGADIVIGVRPKSQRAAEWVFSKISNYFYGISDPMSGFKAYKACIYKSRGGFDFHKSVGSELLFWALKRKYKVVQIRIEINNRNGLPRFDTLIKSNLRILKAIFNVIAKV